MIFLTSLWAVHTCALHALVAFGKDIVVIIQAAIIRQREMFPDMAEQVDQWMHKHGINLSFWYCSNLYHNLLILIIVSLISMS